LEGLTGDVAELGVYRGSTARIIAELATRIGGIAYLFDTFAGLPEGDRLPVDGCSGSFDDTDAVNVSRLMRGTNFRLCQGRFPDTVGMVDAEAKFVLVHIDCDLYVPAKAALEFFYPRLVTGGFLIVHDYSSNFWPGVEKAVDEYFSSSRCIVPMPDKAGSIVVRK
jgi:hypothetical protein